MLVFSRKTQHQETWLSRHTRTSYCSTERHSSERSGYPDTPERATFQQKATAARDLAIPTHPNELLFNRKTQQQETWLSRHTRTNYCSTERHSSKRPGYPDTPERATVQQKATAARDLAIQTQKSELLFNRNTQQQETWLSRRTRTSYCEQLHCKRE